MPPKKSAAATTETDAGRIKLVKALGITGLLSNNGRFNTFEMIGKAGLVPHIQRIRHTSDWAALEVWSKEHLVLHRTSGSTTKIKQLQDCTLADLAAFLTQSSMPTPDQISGYAAAVNRNTQQPPTAASRKTAARLYAIGGVLHHADLYETATMQFEARTVAEGEYPKGSIKRIIPNYGTLKPGVLDRRLTHDELLRALFCAAIVKSDIASLAATAKNRNSTASLGAHSARLLAILDRNEPLATFDLDDLTSDAFKQMTVREYLSSSLHRATLPFKRFPAALGDWECHSAGCIRCLRTFFEPADFYAVDLARTTELREVMIERRTIPPKIRALMTRLNNHAGPWRDFASTHKQLTARPIQVVNGTDAVVRDASLELLAVPDRLIFESDEYPDDTIYAGWVQGGAGAGKPLVFSRWKNPHAECRDTWPAFGTSQTGWSEAWSAAKAKNKVSVYRYNSLRAMSNLCYECGKQLDSPALRLLDGYRPMEMRFKNNVAIADRINNRGIRDAMQKEEKDLVEEQLLQNPGLDQVHVDLVLDGQDYNYDPPTVLDLPYQYISWARNWGQRYSPQQGDQITPPFDASVLLRMGFITTAEYAALWTLHSGTKAESLAHKVVLEITVGDARTGLLTPALQPDDAREKHQQVLDGVAKLLTPVGQAIRVNMPREIVQALQNLARTHHVALHGLDSMAGTTGKAYDPEDPVYEWHRLVVLDKKKWHPSADDAPPHRRGPLQARAVQQSKLFVTLVMHRRATFNDKHNEYVMNQISRSVEALFKSPEHVGSLFKWGVLWQKDHWATWAPNKAGAETTGVGNYMDAQSWITKQTYLDALQRGPSGRPEREAKDLVDKFWDPAKDEAYSLPPDHPYANKVKGQILPADEYASDIFDEVMLGIHAQVGVEIGPVARLFHFHMLLDIKHISKIQLDQRAFREFFIGCWRGHLFDKAYMILDPSGNPWIPPHEQLHIDLRLHAEDEVAAAMDAYVKKQSMNYTAAGLRSLADAGARRDKARREKNADEWFTDRAHAVFNQPRGLSSITTTDDSLRTGLTRRTQELSNLPSGAQSARSTVMPPALVNRSAVVQARNATADDEPELEYEHLTEYEQHRADQVHRNELQMYRLGLRDTAPADPRTQRAPGRTPPDRGSGSTTRR
jgi:hypothetical protein